MTSITIPLDGKIGCCYGRQCTRAAPKTPDSEKITINLGYVDLGQIDLMVQEGLLFEPDRFHPDGDP